MSDQEIWEIALKQLQDAFVVSNAWTLQQRAEDPLRGFSRGWEWGKIILDKFMPSWFEAWYIHQNWEKSLICGDFESWITVVQAFGIKYDDWCEAMKYYVKGYLQLRKISTEQCVKSEVRNVP